MKAFSLLIETSSNISPLEYKFGKDRPESILNILRNPFDPDIDKFIEKECYNNNFNGLISKNIRLLLIAVDLVQPYINILFSKTRHKDHDRFISISWIVGGSYNVDESFIIYSNSYDELEKLVNENFKSVENFSKTSIQKGCAIWNTDLEKRFTFEEILKLENDVQHYIIVAKVDQSFKKQNDPDPKMSPITHFVREN
jgi:hypothetical protein